MVRTYPNTHHLAHDKDGGQRYPHRFHGRCHVYTRLPLNLPYESYRGAFVSPRFRIQELYIQSEFLDIYAVTCMCCESSLFEAQAFSLSVPRGSGSDDSDSGSCSGGENARLLASRRRRMRRIYRSQNFVDSFERGGKRFLVSKVKRSDAELRDVCHQIRQHQQPHDTKNAAWYSHSETGMGKRETRSVAKENTIPSHDHEISGCPVSLPEQVSGAIDVSIKSDRFPLMRRTHQKLSSPVSPCLPSDSPKPLSYAQAAATGLTFRNSSRVSQEKGGGRTARSWTAGI